MFASVLAIDWREIRDVAQRLRWWGFRGHSDTNWPLETSLQRGASLLLCPPNLLTRREQRMVRQFQRRAHHYLRDLPPLQQELDWLALIQHYGGPTRLLDFSHSFYVAAFFAMERAQADAAIWAVDLKALKETIASQMKVDTSKETTDDVNKRHVALANSVLRKKKKLPGVIDVEPDQLHERLTIQQGFFLFPSDTSIPFEANLAKTYGVDPSTFAKPATDLWCDVKSKFHSETERPKILKINIPRTCHYQGMSDLEQMNITATTLFPGLDGFSRSLYFHLRMDVYFDWLTDEQKQKGVSP